MCGKFYNRRCKLAAMNKEDILVIRDVQSGELNKVARLIQDSYYEYARFMPSDAWERYREDIMDVRSRLGAARLIVAEFNGKLAGAVTLYLEVTDNSEVVWPVGWAGIRLLAVHPRYRGHGIGRALMNECVRRCREHGIKIIGLHTTEMMAVAQRMYENMGFRRAPEFDFHPRPDIVVMAYRLDLQGLLQ